MKLPFFGTRRPPLPTAADFGYVELRGGSSRVVMVPALGGRLTAMELGGRQWLWQSDVIPLAPASDGASYLETGDAGGFDECFPTVAPCRVPGWVRTFGGIELPDHGELWSRTPELVVRTAPEGQQAIVAWRGIRLPYRFERAVRVAPDGSVRTDYRLTNDGGERLPFLWAAHPMFPLTEATRLVLPDGDRLRVHARHQIELGEARSEHRWPYVRGSGKAHDFAEPWTVAKRYACKLFVDLTEGHVTLREGEHELVASFETADVPHVGIWINKRGWTPFRREEPYLNLGLFPGIGAPDALSEALGDWKSAAWVEPGADRRWSVTWRARAVPRLDPDG